MAMKVSSEACVGCEACVSYCSMDAITMTAEHVAEINTDECVECGLCRFAGNLQGLFRTPCSHFCPVGIDVPRYIQFVADGRFDEALAVIRERMPFPGICGTVCLHPCEARCARVRLDDPVAIRLLKRFAFENGDGVWKRRTKVRPASGKRVAVVGSGPAGLTAAYYLVKAGHSVAVYESAPEPGGMMFHCIPEYRLPSSVLRSEIAAIQDAGVRIELNCPIDSLKELMSAGYDACLIAIGSQKAVPLGIPGEEREGVVTAVDFLTATRLGRAPEVGGRVAIVGGGNSGIEASRTAVRLGATSVTVFERCGKDVLSLDEDEYEAACEEGVVFDYCAEPTAVRRQGDSVTLQLVRTRHVRSDDGITNKPVAIAGSEFSAEFDTIVNATGQRPLVPQGFGLSVGPGHLITVDPRNLQTSVPGVFAGGDAVLGSSSVVEAIAAGRQAAISIDRYLGGQGDIIEVLAATEVTITLTEEVKGEYRIQPRLLPASDRVRSFEQVELGYSREEAQTEARRCLRCDIRERNCIALEPSEWPRSLRNHYSQPGTPHKATGIAGRGTEEMKTNDVTGRFRRGLVGIAIDVGRPGVGARFKDVDVITQALAKAGGEFEEKNPVTKMMDDPRTGKLRRDVLGEKVMSCVVETVVSIEQLESALDSLRKASKRIDTVISVGCIGRADPDGMYPVRKKLDALGITYRKNGKQNAGLGRPRANV